MFFILFISFFLATSFLSLLPFIVFSLCVCLTTASPGLQPRQSDQEEQRAGVAHGEADPDLPACRGQYTNLLQQVM